MLSWFNTGRYVPFIFDFWNPQLDWQLCRFVVRLAFVTFRPIPLVILCPKSPGVNRPYAKGISFYLRQVHLIPVVNPSYSSPGGIRPLETWLCLPLNSIIEWLKTYRELSSHDPEFIKWILINLEKTFILRRYIRSQWEILAGLAPFCCTWGGFYSGNRSAPMPSFYDSSA